MSALSGYAAAMMIVLAVGLACPPWTPIDTLMLAVTVHIFGVELGARFERGHR